MSIDQPGLRALEREWAIGLVTVVGGFAVALAVAAFLTFGHRAHAVVPDTTQAEERSPPRGVGMAALHAPTAFCRTALRNAKETGVLPAKGRLTDPFPRQTDQEGRFICDAAAGAVQYAIASDAVCANPAKYECVRIYGISKNDGTVIYQRPAD